MPAEEINFDGLVGPTHNYAGLSHGNLASTRNRGRASSPRDAALEGLAKMRLLRSLGIAQAVLPPHERPHLPTLRALGFAGDDARVLASAARADPALLAAACSASAMWAANAATVCPSSDSGDGRVHVTPANLPAQFHRSIEARQTRDVLRAVFPDPSRFAVHEPLPAAPHLADEGAANHLRLGRAHAEPGWHVFVYGRDGFDPDDAPRRFPARQTLQASAAVARLHGIPAARTLLLRQSRRAIDAGAFHNDVVAVANESILLCHEDAFDDPGAIALLRRRVGERFTPVVVSRRRLSLPDAVASYLFNSQLVTRPDGRVALILPAEARRHRRARDCVRWLLDNAPIAEARHVDVRQSMRNGGGPACLRLRVVLTPQERAAMRAGVIFDDRLDAALVAWIERHYRPSLAPGDLRDPALLRESRDALDVLVGILGLPPIYDFQR